MKVLRIKAEVVVEETLKALHGPRRKRDEAVLGVAKDVTAYAQALEQDLIHCRAALDHALTIRGFLAVRWHRVRERFRRAPADTPPPLEA
jgi:hypothetical protein